jgi:hypothetical protein
MNKVTDSTFKNEDSDEILNQLPQITAAQFEELTVFEKISKPVTFQPSYASVDELKSNHDDEISANHDFTLSRKLAVKKFAEQHGLMLNMKGELSSKAIQVLKEKII